VMRAGAGRVAGSHLDRAQNLSPNLVFLHRRPMSLAKTLRDFRIKDLQPTSFAKSLRYIGAMFETIRLLLGTISRLFAALKRRHPRPRLNALDKLFWVTA
jgi:hypothetical protein